MRLYEDSTVVFDKFNDTYRVTFFNKDNHWDGDITFNKNGIIYNNLD